MDGQQDRQAASIHLHPRRVDEKRDVVGNNLHQAVGRSPVTLGADYRDPGLTRIPALGQRKVLYGGLDQVGRGQVLQVRGGQTGIVMPGKHFTAAQARFPCRLQNIARQRIAK